MENYKIVWYKQFAYNPNTARMWDKIPIALNLWEPCIVSQIYPVFEIIDENKLLPEYLLMWFKRAEFDRYARFKSIWSAREIFDREEMCKVELPIPPIQEQQKLINEYNTVISRINLNNNIIKTLDKTIQTIYKQWFIDFDFPNEWWLPYKSNDWKMNYCNELEKNIPDNRRVGDLKELASFIMWQSPEGHSYNTEKQGYPLINWAAELKKDSIKIEKYTSDAKKLNKVWDLLFCIRATLWNVQVADDIYALWRWVASCRPYDEDYKEFIYEQLNNLTDYYDRVLTWSVIVWMTKDEIEWYRILIPTDSICKQYHNKFSGIYQLRKKTKKENEALNKLKDILFLKLSQ